MRIFRAVILAFSTYTRIPMFQVKWSDNVLRLAIAFLPLVGALLGATLWIWQIICRNLELSPILFSAVAIALPVLITGGIHLDGFCDTSDALASWRDSERKLEIMSDPRVGAFAVIRLIVYIVISFALFYEVFAKNYDAGLGFIYIISRCFAAMSVITLPTARSAGMLAAFGDKNKLKSTWIILILFCILSIGSLIWINIVAGIACIILCLLVTLWYRSMTIRHFGGITGDTTGYYLQLIELSMAIGFLIGGIVLEWIQTIS